MTEKMNPTETVEKFAEHQRNALEEAGKALVSLIPQGLRTHGWNAIEETGKGFGVLINAAADGVKGVLKSVDETEKPSVKVSVEKED